MVVVAVNVVPATIPSVGVARHVSSSVLTKPESNVLLVPMADPASDHS